jgi:hypothetical protein
MPGKDIFESSGDEGCDIFRYDVYGGFEGYWCAREIGDNVNAITLRQQVKNIGMQALAEPERRVEKEALLLLPACNVYTRAKVKFAWLSREMRSLLPTNYWTHTHTH